MPRSGFKLTTSRLHSFYVAKVSHALNHSATEADLLEARSVLVLRVATAAVCVTLQSSPRDPGDPGGGVTHSISNVCALSVTADTLLATTRP